MKVGFVGLGRMGQGMARRILGAGHELCVFDMVAAQTAPFGAAGARVASSIADLCSGRDVVVTMLVEDKAIIEVALGPGGLCDSLAKGAIHLVMGTHGVATVRQLESRHRDAGQVLVAAPYSVGPIWLRLVSSESCREALTMPCASANRS